MSKRLIGIEVGVHSLRVAILNRDKGQITIHSLVQREFTDHDQLAAQLTDLLAGEFGIGDQIATSLSTRSAYVRTLKFPFQNESKIAAAIPFELSAQLPVSIETCATAVQKSQSDGEGATVMAAAAPTVAIESLLKIFEAADIPLHRIDLAPFCHVAGLGEQIGDGILACSTDQDITLAILQEGQLVDYRVLPPMSPSETTSRFPALLREVKLLSHTIGTEEEPEIHIMGSQNIEELAGNLQDQGFRVNLLSLKFGDQFANAEFLPAVALALRAQATRTDHSFNFRRGKYQLKGEWANLKGKLALLAALLGLSVIILAGSMTLKYFDKASQADTLRDQMVEAYRELFPTATTVVDVPLQLKSAIREVQTKNNLVSGNVTSALGVLKELSRLPQQFTVEIQEYAMGPDDLKLTGHTVNFETVNRISNALQDSPLFSNVQITDSKMSLDGNRIDFKMLLTFSGQEVE